LTTFEAHDVFEGSWESIEIAREAETKPP